MFAPHSWQQPSTETCWLHAPLHQNHIYTLLPSYLFKAAFKALWEPISWVIILRLAQIKFSISFLDYWLIFSLTMVFSSYDKGIWKNFWEILYACKVLNNILFYLIMITWFSSSIEKKSSKNSVWLQLLGRQ